MTHDTVNTAPLAVTLGDPAGIGPDVVLTALASFSDMPCVVIGDADVLNARAQQLQLEVAIYPWQPGTPVPKDGIAVRHLPCSHPVVPGTPDPRQADAILATLDDAAQGCLDGRYSGMVTAPLSKEVICDGGHPLFTGHTEYLAGLAGCDKVVMMLTARQLRVALATTHLPLSQVPQAITPTNVEQTLRILHHDLKHTFAIDAPRILVLGLNPHAGEGGHLGLEELQVITPVIRALQREGLTLTGPVPADTAFQSALLDEHDAVLAMYHDQGLPVLKYAGFGEAVNVTLGLPFIRTSVDHGTAFPLAGSGKASATSLTAALSLAADLVQRTSGKRLSHG